MAYVLQEPGTQSSYRLIEPEAQPVTSGWDRFTRGLADPIDAGAQLLEHAVSPGVRDTVNSANNWLADNTGLVAPVPHGGVDQMLLEKNLGYQAPEGIDFARMGGNILSPANLAIASRLPILSSILGRVAVGAGSGAVMGAMQPVDDTENFAHEKAKQVAIGTALGGAMPVATTVAGKVISPDVRASVQKLVDENITPTIGQTLGGAWQSMENKATSVPIIGDMIKNAQRRSTEDLNRAAINRALFHIGDKLPDGVKGRAAIEYADQRLSDAYDNVLTKIGAVKPDAQFGSEVSNLSTAVGNLPKEMQEQFDRIVQNEIKGRLNQNGFMTSEGLKAAESNLRIIADGYKRSGDADKMVLGNAVQEARSSLRTMLERVAPKGTAQELRAVNTGQANFYRPMQASQYLGAEEGTFTAAQLQSAVKALDRSKNHKQFATGKALMQDLSEPAKSVLTTYPDSGTVGRSLIAGAPYAAGAAYYYPAQATAAAALGSIAALPYTRPGQALASYLLTGRQGQAAKGISSLVRNSSPYLTAPAVGLLNQF